MGIENTHYQGWHGELQNPWRASMAIVRVALLQVFRRKSYWIVIALGMLNFLIAWGIIYAVTQVDVPREAQQRMLRAFGFSANPEDGNENGYIGFMQRQSVIVMILLAFAGSLLVGSDFRMRSLPFYLSRRIDRRHYIFSKIVAVGAIVMIMTVVPALILFIEYGAFTSSLDYWIDNWRIPVSVIIFGLVQCVVLGTLLVTLSAYLQRMAPIAITWSSLFVLLANISSQLRDATNNMWWGLLDPWRNMRYVGRLCFGEFDNDPDGLLFAQWALLILAVTCTVSMILLVRRVRAVDIVE